MPPLRTSRRPSMPPQITNRRRMPNRCTNLLRMNHPRDLRRRLNRIAHPNRRRDRPPRNPMRSPEPLRRIRSNARLSTPQSIRPSMNRVRVELEGR